jgi:hypothetical protein
MPNSIAVRGRITRALRGRWRSIEAAGILSLARATPRRSFNIFLVPRPNEDGFDTGHPLRPPQKSLHGGPSLARPHPSGDRLAPFLEGANLRLYFERFGGRR